MCFSHHIRRAFVSLAFFLIVGGSATAGTLFGTVTDINDGDTITIICLKRPLQIRLMGIDAPEKDQAYAEVARQHLSDLILQKVVVVEYTGLGDNALIVGKVFLKERDVGAQMIRDGVAWLQQKFR
jgi:endonuclease YncB( thermonuclease family)